MSWLRRLFTRKQMDAELDRELRFHFESQVADKVRSGIRETEARRLTRLEFGGIEQIKEDCRERCGTLWLESTLQDVRFGLRQLRNAPGFTLAAVLCAGEISLRTTLSPQLRLPSSMKLLHGASFPVRTPSACTSELSPRKIPELSKSSGCLPISK